MQNTTRLAIELRYGLDNLLNAMASTDELRQGFLRSAGHSLLRAADAAHSEEEKDLVDTLYEQLAKMRQASS